MPLEKIVLLRQTVSAFPEDAFANQLGNSVVDAMSPSTGSSNIANATTSNDRYQMASARDPRSMSDVMVLGGADGSGNITADQLAQLAAESRGQAVTMDTPEITVGESRIGPKVIEQTFGFSKDENKFSDLSNYDMNPSLTVQRDEPVDEVVVTGQRMTYEQEGYYDFYHPEIMLDRNYRKPGANWAAYQQPLVHVQVASPGSWDKIKSFGNSLSGSIYEPTKDAASKIDTALGAAGVVAPTFVTQMSEDFRKASGIASSWANVTTKFALEDSKLISGLKTFGVVSFGVNTSFAAKDFITAATSNDIQGMIKPSVDTTFGAIGLTGFGAPGSLAYSLTGLFMDTQYAQDKITTPMVDWAWDLNHRDWPNNLKGKPDNQIDILNVGP